MKRAQLIALLNEALSAEYHSFIGHALGSNPYVKPEWERDLQFLERLRDAENANARALLVQMGRCRAGPTVQAFHLWKEDLNFLSLEWLVIRAAEEGQKGIARVEDLIERLPADDAELRATFDSILASKKAAAADVEKLAATRRTERDARREQHRAVTAIKLKGVATPKKAAPAKAAAPGGKSPPLPPGAPRPPRPPLPPGSKPPGPPKPPAKPSPGAPPLPPGFKMPKPPKKE